MFFLYLAVILFVFLLFTGVYTFVVACLRRKELPWLVKEEIEKTSYSKYYDYIVYADRWLKEHHAEDVFITSVDGLRLHGLWVPAKKAKGTILLAHGYRSTYLVDFSPVLDFYYDKGINLLITEQRAHGKSEGRYITFGVKESRDMLSWAEYHNSDLSDCPIILSGLSMGASTMLYLADQPLPKNVRGIIADCGFTSPKEILSSVFKAVTHSPAWICLWPTNLCTRIFAGFKLDEKDTRVSLSRSTVPVLMIHGKEDGFVPCEMTEQAYAVCREPKNVLLVEGADHGLSFVVDRTQYIKTVNDFLEDTGIV